MNPPAFTPFQYRPVHKPNQLICGSGQTAVVTGWTVKSAIAKKLHPSQYAVIGQLYSPTRGINFLVRNLLANPHVRSLVILNATREDHNARACECLVDFLREGFSSGTSDIGRPCWVINSPVRGYIDPEIPAEALEELRRSLTGYEVDSIAAALSQIQTLSQQPPQSPWGNAREFPCTETTPTLLPGDRYGHRIEGKTIAETWVKIIHRIKTTGTIRPTQHDSQWQELIDLMAIVTDEPEEFYFPEPNYLPCDRAFIQPYTAQILDNPPDQEGIKYTYGQRLRSWFGVDQIQQVIDKLVADPDSARAVMTLWDVQDHTASDSPPCLNHIWVRIVEGELSLTATFRSNDMFSAWVPNAIGLRALQRHILAEIQRRLGEPGAKEPGAREPGAREPGAKEPGSQGAKVNNPDQRIENHQTPPNNPLLSFIPHPSSFIPLRLGPLITISQSAHIYDDCWENADRLIATQYARIHQQRDYQDPVGNFVISLQYPEIQVEHMTPGSGETVGCFVGKTATQLYQQIAATCPALQVEHALYLGSELKKAEIALGLGRPELFEQDKPLKLEELQVER